MTLLKIHLSIQRITLYLCDIRDILVPSFPMSTRKTFGDFLPGMKYHSSDSDSEPSWDKELFNAVRKRQRKNKKISEVERLEEIGICLEEGADINAINGKGNTILHIAVRKRYVEIIKFLLDKKAKFDIINCYGETAIALAESLDNNNSGILNLFKEHLNRFRPKASPGERFSPDASCQEETNTAVQEPTRSEISRSFTPSTSSLVDPQRGVCAEKPKRKRQEAAESGRMYEIKLLMLFFKRGHFTTFSFRLETQVEKGEKFDDVVFRYSDQRDYFFFFQAKHIADECKKITSTALINEQSNGEWDGYLCKYFNLQKYFVSYLKILKEFPSDSVKTVIIFTNINFDIDDLHAFGIYAQKIQPPGMILDLASAEKESSCYKLHANCDSVLYEVLKETSDLKRLAKELLKHVFDDNENTKTIRLHDKSIFLHYHTKLAKEVIDIAEGKFKTDFIKGHGISRRAKIFREALLNTASHESEDAFWECVRNRKLKFSKGFGEVSKKGNEFIFELPNDVVNIESIRDFLDHLIFAVNQPNSEQLGNIIENQELKEAFNLINTKFIMSSLENTIRSWVNEKKDEKGWISNEESKKFFDQAKQVIIASQVVGITLEHKHKILNSGVEFKKSIRSLNVFLQSENRYQFLHIISSLENVLLNSIKVCQFLRHSDNYRADDSHIFVSLESLLGEKLLKNVVEAFGSTKNDLLIMQCNSLAPPPKIEELFDKVSVIIKADTKKKVILIGEKNNALARLLKKNLHEHYEHEEGAIGFNDLTPDSQRKVLESEVAFQGQKIRLRELIGETSREVIDTSILVKLIKNEEIAIGNRPLCLGDLEASFTQIYEDISAKNLVHALLQNSDISNLFMISGILQQDFESIKNEFIQRLGIKSDDIHIINNLKDQMVLYPGENLEHEDDASDFRIGDGRIALVRGQEKNQNFNHFKRFCRTRSDRTIHWVEVMPEYIRWQQLYDPNFYIKREFNYRKKVIIKRDIKKHFEKVCNSNIFFFTNVNYEEGFTDILKIPPEEMSKIRKYITKNRIVILKHSGKNAEKTFEKLCQGGIAVHWIEMEDGRLVWQRSEGSLDALRELIDEDCSETLNLDEGQFVEKVKDKVVFIADEPGMGKTTTLINLAGTLKKRSPSDLVALLSIKDYRKVINSLPSDEITMRDAVQFFSDIDTMGLSTSIARSLIEHHLKPEMKRSVFLLFDGFDEINDVQKEKMLKLLQFLKRKTSARVWITSRPSKIDNVENSLSVFATKFEELSGQKRIEFLKIFWKVPMSLTLEKFESQNIFLPWEEQPLEFAVYTKALFERADKALGKSIARFLGIPLQLRLFAEVFRDEFTTFVNAAASVGFLNLTEFDVLDIFKRFIDTKYDIYFKEKKALDDDDDIVKDTLLKSFNEYHKILAFNILFPNAKQMKVLMKKRKMLFPKDESFLKSVGIVQSIGKVGESYFIHKTFAEYFAAGFLSDILLKNRDESDEAEYEAAAQFVLEESFRDENEILRNFLDRFLAHDLPMHTSVLNNDERAVEQLLLGTSAHDVNVVDHFGRTALHLACQMGNSNIVRTLLHVEYDTLSLDHFNRTALHYAARFGFTEVIECLLVGYAEIDRLDRNEESPLHYAVKNKHWVAAIYLVFYGADTSWLTEAQKDKLLSYAPSDIYYDLRQRIGLCIEIPAAVNSYDNRYDNLKSRSGYIVHRGTEVIRSFIKILLCEGKSRWNFQDYSLLVHFSESDNFSDDDCLKVLKIIIKRATIKRDVRAGGISFKSSDVTNILESAAMKGHLKTFEFLFSVFERQFCDLYIYVAAKNNQLSIVNYLWKFYCNDTVDYLKNSVLHSIAHGGMSGISLKIIKYFINLGADVNATNDKGETPLHMAICSNCRLNVVKCLMENGADVNHADCGGRTPLYHAISYPPCYLTGYPEYYTLNNNQLNIIKYLVVDCGARVEISSELTDNVIEYIESPDAFNPNFVDGFNMPRLHRAIRLKEEKLARFLLGRGADVNGLDENGWTPLHWGACSDDAKMVKLLSQYGAMYNAKNNNGEIPFDLSQTDEKYHESASFLDFIDQWFNKIDEVIDVMNNKSVFIQVNFMAILHARNSNKDTLLHVTAKKNNLHAMIYLLKFSHHCFQFKSKGQFIDDMDYQAMDIDSENLQGDTPMHIAAAKGYVDIVAFLLKIGAIFNSRNKEGHTPKRLAEMSKYTRVVGLLRSFGNKEDLHTEYLAERCKHENIVEMLQVFSNRDGPTPEYLAEIKKHRDIAKLLRSLGSKEALNPEYLETDEYGCIFKLMQFFGKREGLTLRYLTKMDEHKRIIELLQSLKNQERFSEINECQKGVGNSWHALGSKKLTNQYLDEITKHENIIKLLQSFGNRKGFTPEFLATRFKSVNLIELLQSFRNKEGLTDKYLTEINTYEQVIKSFQTFESIFNAVKNNEQLEIEKLIGENANVNVKDSFGKTLLHWAARNGYIKIARLVLNLGANIEASDKNHWTPLHYAAESNLPEIIKWLLENGAIYNPKSKQGKTPLDLLKHQTPNLLKTIDRLFQDIQCDYPELVIADLKQIKYGTEHLKAVVNSRDSQGNTLLHYACKEDCFEITEFLLQNDARREVTNNKRQTPKFLAHHQEIIHLLESSN